MAPARNTRSQHRTSGPRPSGAADAVVTDYVARLALATDTAALHQLLWAWPGRPADGLTLALAHAVVLDDAIVFAALAAALPADAIADAPALGPSVADRLAEWAWTRIAAPRSRAQARYAAALIAALDRAQRLPDAAHYGDALVRIAAAEPCGARDRVRREAARWLLPRLGATTAAMLETLAAEVEFDEVEVEYLKAIASHANATTAVWLALLGPRPVRSLDEHDLEAVAQFSEDLHRHVVVTECLLASDRARRDPSVRAELVRRATGDDGVTPEPHALVGLVLDALPDAPFWWDLVARWHPDLAIEGLEAAGSQIVRLVGREALHAVLKAPNAASRQRAIVALGAVQGTASPKTAAARRHKA